MDVFVGYVVVLSLAWHEQGHSLYKQDERYATQFEEQFDAIIEESSLYREELRAIITDLRKKNIDDANERDSTLAKLREEDEEQRYAF